MVTPLATPLLNWNELDVNALERLIEHVIVGGVSGIFVLGTTGEAPGLSLALRREVIRYACQIVAGRVPVLAGITDTSLAESLTLAEYAAAQHASAAVLAPPFYFPLSQHELLGYLERVTRVLPLPLFLYNIPSLTKVSFAPETVHNSAVLPGVVGFKDSSGDVGYLRAVRAAAPELPLFCGPEEILLQAIEAGADGGVCGGSNLFPGLYVRLSEAARSGEKHAATLQELVLRISESLYRTTEDGSAYLRGLKAALAELGLCNGQLAEPYVASDTTRQQVQARVQELTALVQHATAW